MVVGGRRLKEKEKRMVEKEGGDGSGGEGGQRRGKKLPFVSPPPLAR